MEETKIKYKKENQHNGKSKWLTHPAFTPPHTNHTHTHTHMHTYTNYILTNPECLHMTFQHELI